MNEANNRYAYAEDNFSLEEWIRSYLKHKWWFILSVTLCIVTALIYLYILKTPLYKIQSSLIIKDQKKGETIALNLKELDFLDEEKIVDNEAEVLRSQTNIKNVVNSLSLNIQYYDDLLLKKQPLFENTPVHIQVLKAPAAFYGSALLLQLTDSNSFILKNTGQQYKYGEEVSFQNALFKLEKSSGVTAFPRNLKIIVAHPDEITLQLRSAVTALAPSKNSSLLYVSILHPSKATGVKILGKIIEEYEKLNDIERARQKDSLVAVIDNRLRIIGEQMQGLENKEQQYKQAKGITFLSDDAKLYLDQIKESGEAITQAETQLFNLNKIEDYLNGASPTAAPPNTNLTDPIVTGIVLNLSNLGTEKEKLLKQSGPSHPSVLAVNEQIENLRKSLSQNIALQKSNLTNKLSLLKKNQNLVYGNISAVPSVERNLLELMREKNIREQIYTYLLQKREEAAISDAPVFTRMRLIDTAFSSPKPVKPNKPIVLATALFAGLLLPFIILSLAGILRRRINATLFKKISGAQSAAYVLRVKKFSYDVYRDETTPVNTYFNRLRIMLEKREFGKAKKIIVVSSPAENDGKSFVSLNLAVSFARSKCKTALIELNEKQKIQQLFAELPDVSDQLSNQKNSGITITSPVPDLFCFTGIGKTGGNGRSITPHLFIKQMREQFDVVIINTNPFLQDTDAHQLDAISDMNLMIIRNNATRLKHISMLKKFIDSNEIKEPLYVFNDVNASGTL
jgi:tyrosine-protein kinase Etk/Wzc